MLESQGCSRIALLKNIVRSLGMGAMQGKFIRLRAPLLSKSSRMSRITLVSTFSFTVSCSIYF